MLHFCLINRYHPYFSDLNKIALPPYYTEKYKNRRTLWISIRKFSGKAFCFLPYFLINPDYCKQPSPEDELNYTSFAEMPTNNGTAIGLTFEEAMLHAINELIERDALSCFLLKTFCKKTPQKIKVVSKATLPEYIFQIINEIEKTYQEKLLIVDISNDALKCAVFLASFTKQNQSIQPMGSGASLNPEYALERAVLEALQSFHLTDDNIKSEDKQILEKFHQWPKLQKCAQCNLRSITNIEFVGFKPSETSDYELHKSLNFITKALENNHLPIFYATHYKSKNGITYVKAVIPGLEQFHRVRYGSFVIPGPRGQAILLNHEVPIAL